MTTRTGEIVLLDLASQQPCRPWLRHSLKGMTRQDQKTNERLWTDSFHIRLVLKYKQIQYTTDWVGLKAPKYPFKLNVFQTEYPEIQDKIKPHLPPNKSGLAYTIPTVKLANDTWVTDSYAIVEALERLRPSPSLHFDSPYQAKVDELAGKVMQKIGPNCYSRIPRTLLNDASREYWYRTRQERLGVSVDEYEARHGGDEAYVEAASHLKQLTQLLVENEGPYFMGNEMSYADFSWVAFLVFFQRVDQEVFAKVLDASGNEAAHRALLEACTPWLYDG